MKEVAWVIGTSASGKETFVRNVQVNPDLLHSLGWAGRVLAVSECSVRDIGQFEHDPVTLEREGILTEVPALLDRADLILIKWQIVDTAARRPQRLKRLLPEVRHRLLELKAPQEELVIRLRQKPWWDNDGAEAEFINKELGVVTEAIQGLATFEHTVVLSSANSYSVESEK